MDETSFLAEDGWASSALYVCLVLLALGMLLAAPLTHMIGGKRWYGSDYSWFQPFIGGVHFVVLQALGWTLWSGIVAYIAYILYVGIKGFTVYLITAVGVAGLVAQLLIFASLYSFVPNACFVLYRSLISAGRAPTPEVVASDTPSEDPAAAERPSPRGRWGVGLIGVVIIVLSFVVAFSLDSVSRVAHDYSIDSKGYDPADQSIWIGHTSLTAFVISSILITVPLTHYIGGTGRYGSDYRWFQPFSGGTRFVILQMIGWTAWSMSLLVGVLYLLAALTDTSLERYMRQYDWSWVPLMSTSEPDATNDSASTEGRGLLRVLFTTAGFAGVISQVLVFVSLRYFDSHMRVKMCVAARVVAKTKHRVRTVRPWKLPNEPIPLGKTSLSVLTAGDEVLYVRNVALTPRDGHLSPGPTLKHRQPSESKVEAQEEEPEHFTMLSYDPPAVSTVVPVTEMWNKDTRVAYQLEYDDEHGERGEEEQPSSPEPTVDDDLTDTEIDLLATSASAYWHSVTAHRCLRLRKRIIAEVIVGFFYLVPLVGSLVTIGFVLLVPYYFKYGWLIVIVVGACYGMTYRGTPHVTGRRSWPLIRKNELIWTAFERYFRATLIPPPSQGSIRAGRTYLFGFHPHGCYPVSVLWATRGRIWRELFPNVEVDVLGASVMFFPPFLRDVVMWSGGREVSRKAIRHCFANQRSVLIVPGGQREMRHQMSHPVNVKLVTRHKGFIRMAVKHGVDLVPMFSFGENDVLHNVYAPKMQAWTTKRMGFGFPIWPYGRFYSPLPNRIKVSIVVGDPIPVQQQDDPDEKFVQKLADRYFGQIREMFERHKHHLGYGDSKLIFVEE